MTYGLVKHGHFMEVVHLEKFYLHISPQNKGPFKEVLELYMWSLWKVLLYDFKIEDTNLINTWVFYKLEKLSCRLFY